MKSRRRPLSPLSRAAGARTRRRWRLPPAAPERAVRAAGHGRLLLAGLLAGLAAAPAMAQQQPAGAPPAQPPGSIVGRVVDSLSNAVAGATIDLTSTGIRTISGTDGAFVLEAIPPGLYVLRVRRVGFRQLLATVAMGPGRRYSLEIELSRGPFQLDSVVVQGTDATPVTYRGMAEMEEFYRRRMRGTGSFLTRADIEKAPAGSAATLLRSVPGLSVQTGQVGQGESAALISARCGRIEDVPPGDTTTVSMLGASQRLAVVLNGMRVAGSPVEILTQLRTEDIEAMEIYRGSSELPPELMGNACMAIVIHTRK